MPEDPGLLGRTVLVIEDNALISFEIENAVAALGYTVLGPACGLAEAQRLLDGGLPDAALLDVQLDPGTATPIAERLRAARVPYAVITGYDQRDLVESVWQGVPYLAKPFSERELQALVRELLLAEPG